MTATLQTAAELIEALGVVNDRAAMLVAENERNRTDWNRFHHVMKDHGLHPGRTDDDLIDLLDAALTKLGADAKRYRWLWNNAIVSLTYQVNNHTKAVVSNLHCGSLQSAIDAAIAKEQP